MEAVSQLDRDASSVLATIREWKNSFAFINRIPTDIISLIPTHLASQKDRFHAASVCRHWRRVLLKNGTLWSQLFLVKGEDCVSTLLERAKGSPLDIIAHRHPSASTVALISSRSQQIECLEFSQSHWKDIITISESISGRLPLLRKLKIANLGAFASDGQSIVATPFSLPFFRGSTNLEKIVLHSRLLPILSRFIFPNLTVFELSAYQVGECNASYLLDFLKAAPTLETVEVELSPRVILRGVPQEMVVVLPNVRSFSLQVTHDPTTHVYDIAAHISCPRARDTSLAHRVNDVYVNDNMGVFPTPDSWNVIAHQYTASPIEEVTIETKHSESGNIECFLTFRSSSMTVLRSGFEVTETGVDGSRLGVPRAEIGWEILCQALTNLRDCPLLSHVKRIHIEYNATISDIYTNRALRIGRRVQELFGSLGPLDELTIHGCDLHIFLAKFVDDLGNCTWEQPVVLPRIKELAIMHPMAEDGVGIFAADVIDAIVELAKSQHARGIPFERLTVHTWDIPAWIEEQLAQWVDTVDCDGSVGCPY